MNHGNGVCRLGGLRYEKNDRKELEKDRSGFAGGYFGRGERESL